MEIGKAPPLDLPANSAKASSHNSDARTTLIQAPLVGDAAIRPLDVKAALQILIAEVQLALQQVTSPGLRDAGLPGAAPAGVADLAAAGESPGDFSSLSDQAARFLVGAFLRALPPETEAQLQSFGNDAATPSDDPALHRTESQWQSGIERAIDIVTLWRGTPAAIPKALRAAGVQAQAIIRDELDLPVLLRPEWLGFALQLQRLRRRRRRFELRPPDPERVVSDDVEPQPNNPEF